MSQQVKKVLLLIATILIFINLGIFLVESISRFIAGTFMNDFLAQLDYYLNGSLEEYIDVETFKTIFAWSLYIGTAISLTLHIIVGVVFAKRINLNSTEFQSKKVSLIVWSIVSILFGVSFIAGVLGLIAGIPGTTENVNRDFNNEPQAEQIENRSEIVEKISSLKKLRDSGVITDEEYNKLLSDLIK